MTNYTTTVEIPKDSTGDQRIYFTDEYLFEDRMLKVKKEEISRIIEYNFEIANKDTELYYKITQIIEKNVGKCPSHSQKNGVVVYNKDVDEWKIKAFNKVAKTFWVMHLKSESLPKFVALNISKKTLKTLEEHVFAVPNHKKI